MEEDKKIYTLLVDFDDLCTFIRAIAARRVGFNSDSAKLETVQRIFNNQDLLNDLAKDLWDFNNAKTASSKEFSFADKDKYFDQVNRKRIALAEKWANILWKPFTGVTPEGYKKDETVKPG